MDTVELRPVEKDEIAAVAALVRATEAHDGIPRVLADEELEQDFTASHVDLEADTRVAVRAGELIGWSYVWNPPSTGRLDRADLEGGVAPEHRGVGVGRALFGWSVDRARERFAEREHALPRFIRVNAYDWLEDRARLYQHGGFAPVRWHDDLLRSLKHLPPVVVPEGIALLPWPDNRDEEILAVRNAAWADHWGSTVMGAEVWHDFSRGHGARPDLGVVALDEGSGRIVGVCCNHAYPEDEAVTGRRDAYVATVATVREARGRGVASAMIARSLETFAAAGFSHAALDVDADNPTGAARLYRNLGFEPHLRSVTYQIEVPA